jgi:DNA-directed RNA polymerase subunit L
VAKKKVEPNDGDVDELDDDSFKVEDVESHYPNLEGKKKSGEESTNEIEEEFLEEEEFEIEPKVEFPEYKHLGLDIKKGLSKNDYKLIIKGQSHGFCNILVKHLLNVEGVKLASYKITGIDHPEVYIRIEDGYKIKDVLFKGIDILKNEVSEVYGILKKLM